MTKRKLIYTSYGIGVKSISKEAIKKTLKSLITIANQKKKK